MRRGAVSSATVVAVGTSSADLQLPIGKSVGGKRPVAVIVDLGRAVRLEVLRDLGLAIFLASALGETSARWLA